MSSVRLNVLARGCFWMPITTAGCPFDAAVPRPSAPTGDRYNRVSNAFFSTVHGVLAGEREAADSLAELDQRLADLLGEGP